MKTAIFLVVTLLAIYRANGISKSPNMYQDPGNESGDMSFSPRKEGPVVSTAKYPYVAIAKGFTSGSDMLCFIVNKYFCVIAGVVDIPAPDALAKCTVTTGVEDTGSTAILGSVHSVTGAFQHPIFDETIVEFQITVLKVCPPYTESAVTFPAKDAVLTVGTSVLTVGYTASADANGKHLLREVTTTVKDSEGCAMTFIAFVVGKSFCIQFSADLGATSVEKNSIVLSDGKAYGEIVAYDAATNLALVQPFSNVVDWIATNTVPL